MIDERAGALLADQQAILHQPIQALDGRGRGDLEGLANFVDHVELLAHAESARLQFPP